eukprot:TRINITY_DN5289_c0_g2_i1.p1 TRINITY_DN5289_c0_g2~~TRINITY_DN5289_c0_g2_i1.p1  ORF type:complete len:233 (+),score=53.90 TRINITY_DN5289_c0_g2_i1:54-752(+)
MATVAALRAATRVVAVAPRCFRTGVSVGVSARRLVVADRHISSAAATAVAKNLQAELKYETENYEQPSEVKNFLKSSSFKFVEADADVNLCLEREMGDKVVRIEWQLTSPVQLDEENEEAQAQESVDLAVSVENKLSGAGLTIYCSTMRGEDHRYVIGNVKCFANAEERQSLSGYNGPEFEDLDDKLQEAFDEYLAEIGMGSEVCDFVEAMASDKEQREYVHWLKTAKKIFE